MKRSSRRLFRRGKAGRLQRLFKAHLCGGERSSRAQQLFFGGLQGSLQTAHFPPGTFACGEVVCAFALQSVELFCKGRGAFAVPLGRDQLFELRLEAGAVLLQVHEPLEMGAVQPALLFQLDELSGEPLALAFPRGELFAKCL